MCRVQPSSHPSLIVKATLPLVVETFCRAKDVAGLFFNRMSRANSDFKLANWAPSFQYIWIVLFLGRKSGEIKASKGERFSGFSGIAVGVGVGMTGGRAGVGVDVGMGVGVGMFGGGYAPNADDGVGVETVVPVEAVCCASGLVLLVA